MLQKLILCHGILVISFVYQASSFISKATTSCIDKVTQCSSQVYRDVVCQDDTNAITFCQKSCGKCPVDGGYSTWLPWSDCSVSCGGPGRNFRVRTCDDPKPQYNGQPCQGAIMEQKTCDNGPCSGGSTQTVTSKGSITANSKTTHTTPLFTSTAYSISTPVVNSVSTPVLNSSPLAVNSTQTPVTNSTPTPIAISTTTPFPVTNSQHVCRDHALCSEPHMKLTACNDLYLSKTFCPKLCHLCGPIVTPPTCTDLAGTKCMEKFFKYFTCSDPGLTGLCRLSCGVCHI